MTTAHGIWPQHGTVGGRRQTWLLVAIYVLSLGLNAVYCLGFEGRFVIVKDAAAYDMYGLRLAQGQGFPTGPGLQPSREPGVYVFLGGIYSIFGHSPRAARVVQAVLTSTFCVLVYLIARRFRDEGYFPPAVPLVAAALTAFYPAYVFYAGVLLRETLTTFLFLLSLVPLTDFVLTRRGQAAAAYGLLAGLGALVDGRLLYFAVFVGFVLFAVTREWRRTATFLAVAVGAALLVISPWTIRNYLVFDRFVLLATSQYKGLYLVTGPEELLTWDWESDRLRPLRDLPLAERDQQLARLAMENLRQNPLPYLTSSPRRFFRLWIGGHSNVAPFWERSTAAAAAAGEWGYVAIKMVFLGWNLIYVIGGFAGAVVFVRRVKLEPVLHLVAFVVYLSLLHMALFATPRYQLPAMPVLTIFLAYLMTVAAPGAAGARPLEVATARS